jgi:hypothetical protein
VFPEPRGRIVAGNEAVSPAAGAGSLRKATMNPHSGRPGTESVDVVGAGQAGLAVSYYLWSSGVEHLVLKRGRVGASWRSQRDSARIAQHIAATAKGKQTWTQHRPLCTLR